MNHIIRKFLHVQSMQTRINLFGSGNNGGSRPILCFYSSWSISTSLYEELSAATLANNANPPQPKQSLVVNNDDVDAPLRWPRLMLPSIKDKITGDVVHRFFNPVDKNTIRIKTPLPNKVRCFWSSHGWLAFIDPSDCGLYLWNPSSSNDVIRLPSIESLPSIVGVKHNDAGAIRKFIRKHSWQCHVHENYTPKQLSNIIMQKLCFSAAPSLSTENNDSIVMAIEDHSRNLAFCKPGGTEWTALDGPLLPYEFVIPSNIDKVFYARSRRVVPYYRAQHVLFEELEAWDLRDLSSIKRTLINYKQPDLTGEDAFAKIECSSGKYLVESSGDLLLVYKYVADCGVSEDGMLHDTIIDGGKLAYKTYGFSVYRFDFCQGKWNSVKCLGDRALFVGWSTSFSLRASDYPGLRPNSIYFADCYAARVNVKKLYHYGGHDMGVFNLEDNSIEHYYPFGHLKTILPPPFWVAPHSSNDA